MPTAVVNRALVKAAAGDTQTFETALASIGRSVISSRAPVVSKYEIGFQVLDQDDDNTRAVGVFGYKIGGRLYYVPMFYRDGVTKGVEQLRDPKRKRTVPLTDNWVNKLTVEKGDDPPKLIDRSRISDTARPSLWQLKFSPTKWASAAPEADFDAIRRDLAPALTNGGTFADAWTDAPDLMKLASEHPALMAGVDELVRLYPWYAEALDKYHGRAKVAAALEALAAIPPRPKRVKTASLMSSFGEPSRPKVVVVRATRIVMSKVPHESTDYTPSELADLGAGNNVYSDRRGDDEVSVMETAWGDGPGGGTSLSNPDYPGVQKVLGDDMKLHECAVLFALTAWTSKPGRCLVVRVSDGAWCVTDRNAVWVLANEGVDLDAGVKWHESLQAASSVTNGKRCAAVYLAPGKQLHASVPFTSDENGYVIDSCTYTDRPYWARAGETHDHDPGREDHFNYKVRVVDGAGRMVVASNCLYLPGNDRTRLVALDYDKKKFRPANGDDPDRYLMPGIKAASENAHVLHMSLSRHGAYGVEDPRTAEKVAFDKAADLEAYLVESHHLRPATARAFVTLCATAKQAHAVVRYPVKAAAGAEPRQRLETNFPNAPGLEELRQEAPGGFDDDIAPSEGPQSVAMTVNDLTEQPGTSDRYTNYPLDAGAQIPIPGIGNSGDASTQGPGGGTGGGSQGLTAEEARRVAGAAQSGVKELFDTTSIAALVKRKRIDPVIDKITKACTSVMNALADGLCHLYWNSDDWADRFGQTELGPLEDQFRDHFEGLGDMSLGLEEKNVDSGRDFGLLPELANVDASQAAGA